MLWQAYKRDQYQIMKLLLEHKADPNIISKWINFFSLLRLTLHFQIASMELCCMLHAIVTILRLFSYCLSLMQIWISLVSEYT